MSETALYLDPEQLCVGLYIHLDLSWMDHSFTFSNFKIRDDRQLAEVRALQLKRVRYDPARSDCKPLPPAVANAAQPLRPAGQPSPKELAAQQAKQARVEKLRAMRQNLLELDKKLQKASHTARNITRNVRNQPQETRVQAQALVNEIVTVMLGDGTVLMHALNGKSGEDCYFHALNVTVLSVMLARVLQLSREESLLLGLGALLHDIGKVDIPSKILLKTEALNKPEQNLMQRHCEYGVKHAERMGVAEQVSRIIQEHHEFCDGSGYPRKLTKERIDQLSRIVCITNQYDNLCNPLNLDTALTPHEALSRMFSQQRGRYDEIALKAFIRCLGVYPPGCIVQLSNEMIGLVLGVNPNKPLRPTLIVHDPDIPREEAIILDLEEETELNISKSLRPGQLPRDIYNYLSPRQNVTYFFAQQQASGA